MDWLCAKVMEIKVAETAVAAAKNAPKVKTHHNSKRILHRRMSNLAEMEEEKKSTTWFK